MKCFWNCSAVAIFAVATLASTSDAAVIVTADPGYPAGAELFTVDPLATLTPAGRGITPTRDLTQTFQTTSTFDVRGIVISHRIQNGDNGYNIDVHEVDDINANPLVLGSLVSTINIPIAVGSLPTTSENLGFSLNGADVFSLPQRDTGTEGYALTVTTPGATADVGLMHHTNESDRNGDPVDHYVPGQFYKEGLVPASTSARRDLGILLSSSAIIPEPTSLVLMAGCASLMLLRRK